MSRIIINSDISTYEGKHKIVDGKYGKYEILELFNDPETGNKLARIRFIDSGKERVISYTKAISGNVMNPDYATIAGVGIVDIDINNDYFNRIYRMWSRLINKCYNPNDRAFPIYGGKNITINEKWFRLSGFIEDLEQMENYNNWLNDSEYHLNCYIKTARDNNIIMDLSNTILSKEIVAKGNRIDFDKIYYNKAHGYPYKIIKEEPSVKDKYGTRRYVTVQFLVSGSIKEHVLLQKALNGVVKDVYHKMLINNSGCLGNTTSTDAFGKKRAYHIWYDLMSRCYNPNDARYSTYGAAGVTVCDRWTVYENFERDLMYIPGYNEWIRSGIKEYNLDKDLLQQGLLPSEKVYSPFTCAFVSARDNAAERHIREGNNSINTPQIPLRNMCVHREDVPIEDRYKYHKPIEMCRIVDKNKNNK